MAALGARGRVRETLLLLLPVLMLGASVLIVLNERARSLASSMPQVDAAPSPLAPKAEKQARFAGTLHRLTDELDRASVTVPAWNEPQVVGLLKSHWRRHPSPFAGPRGERGKFVQSVSLVRRKEKPRADGQLRGKQVLGKQVLGPGLDAETRRRELRETQVFGLGEGSFDERESIVLPAPAELRFPLALPEGARLRFSEAVLGESNATFVIKCGGKSHPQPKLLHTDTLDGPSKHWKEVTVELGACGSDTELTISVKSPQKGAAIGLLGSPVILAKTATPLPYNVVFIIVDAMRGDAIAAAHDDATDARIRRAPHPPLDAVFARIPETSPNLNQLATRGMVFQNAWSAAMWTRPSTVAMLSGRRSSRLGLSVLELELRPGERQRFYDSRPPMLPRFFRESGADTAGIVDNMYLSGSVGVGVDYAMQSLVDHRYEAQDTHFITDDALKYLESRKDERFFLLLNYASPHSPYVPPKQDLDAIAKAKGLPEDPTVRRYLAEIHKDDRAIGEVLRKLEELKLVEQTLVVVTADHGETMSVAHDQYPVDVVKGMRSGRFTHLSTMWEEAAKVALLVSLPGRIPTGKLSQARVQTLDLLPTILELEGLPQPEGLDGRSLLPLFAGSSIEDRPIVIEGRGARSIQVGDYRLIVREPIAQRLKKGKKEFEKKWELYDHGSDPGERHDVASKEPERVKELAARLEKLLGPTQPRESPADLASTPPAVYELKFSLGSKSGHVALALSSMVEGVDSNREEGEVSIESTALPQATISGSGKTANVSFDMTPGETRTLKVRLSPASARLGWSVTLDGSPWPRDKYFGGALGQRLFEVETGLSPSLSPHLLESSALPYVSGTQELGLFVIREVGSRPRLPEVTEQEQAETEEAMQAWGYARKGPKKR